MKLFADLHLHSHYSRATSKEMNVLDLSKYAKYKGLNLLGTGDFTHPKWLAELKEKLKPSGEGLYEYDGTYYVLKNEGLKLTIREYREFVFNLVKKYPIHYIEDTFEEDDFNSFSFLLEKVKPKLVCGDDLYTTNLSRLTRGIKLKSTNAIIIKPNQIGTITDMIEVVKTAKKYGMKTILSHRSGETEDTLISHLAVGLGCDFVKMGIAGERVVKLNELARIEEKIK
jgi:enolase